MCGSVSGILILFHWSVWLYGCTLLFWLLYVWNIFWNHKMMAAVLLLFLETTLAAWGFFCHFISILGFFSISVKNAIGICIGIEHIPLCSIQLKIKLSQKEKDKKGKQLFEACMQKMEINRKLVDVNTNIPIITLKISELHDSQKELSYKKRL